MRFIGYLNHLFVPLKWKTDNLFKLFLLPPKPSQYHSHSTYHFPRYDSTNFKHSQILSDFCENLIDYATG